MKLDQLSDVIGSIYDGALEPDRWPHALKRVADLCQSPFAFVLSHDVERNQHTVRNISSATRRDHNANESTFRRIILTVLLVSGVLLVV